jgi:HrpA-like RNA helicase
LIREYDTEGVFQGTSLKESIATKYESVIGKAKPVNIRELGLLDSPSADSLHYALDKLYLLGFIDAQSKPTRLGIIASKFRFVNLECIKMILSGFAWGASIIDLVTLAAFLQFPKTALFANMREADFLHSLKQNEFSLFESDNDRYKMQKSEQSRMFVADDFIRLLLIFREVNDKISELKGDGTPDDDSSDDDLPKKTIVMGVSSDTKESVVKDESKPEPLAFETPSGPVPTKFMGPKDAVGENTSLDTSENTASSDKIRDLEDEDKKEEDAKPTPDAKDQAVKGGDFVDDELAEESSSDDEVYFGGGKPFKKNAPNKSAKPMRPRTPLEQYLGDRGMIASGFTQIVERRDEIIHMLASMGFNPYQGWRESLDQVVDETETEKLAFVKKIKQCLYEGFRNNVAVWDAAAGTFRTLKSHLKLPIESDLMRFQPKFLIYDSILMTGDSINMYEAKLNYLGVLDGFVEVDINFEALISQT